MPNRHLQVKITQLHRFQTSIALSPSLSPLRTTLYFPDFFPWNFWKTVMGSIVSDLVWLLKKPVEYRREGVAAHDGSTLHLDW